MTDTLKSLVDIADRFGVSIEIQTDRVATFYRGDGLETRALRCRVGPNVTGEQILRKVKKALAIDDHNHS